MWKSLRMPDLTGFFKDAWVLKNCWKKVEGVEKNFVST